MLKTRCRIGKQQSELSNSRGRFYDSELTGRQMPGTERQRQPAFQFGVFEINPQTRELRKHGVRLKLQDQPLEVLLLLLEHPGEIVTREEIQKRLWPENTYVDFDNAINSAIRKLRDALGDSPENPRFVETLARRGYRFISPVSRSTSVPVRDPPHLPTQPVQVPITPSQPGPHKHRLVWIVSTLVVVLGAMGMALRWWTPKSNQAHPETALPAVPLTGNRGYEEFPAFSPEGTRVAFTWQEPGKQVPNVYVKLIGQGDAIRLTTNASGDFAPVWSPDGHWIAFLRARQRYSAAVIVIPSLGGPEREVAEVSLDTSNILRHWESYSVPPPFLAWSSDGRWLLSIEENAPRGAFSIVRISAETGTKRVLTFPPKETSGDGGLAVSPDGKTLAFTRTLGLFEKDIYLVSLSEDTLPRGVPRRLTFDSKEIDGLAWTPDGHRLVFSSRRGGRRGLWQMSVSPAGQPVRLTDAGDDPRDVAIAREGFHLVYSHLIMDSHISRMGLDRNERKQAHSFIASTRHELLPKYSPDGRRIAFQSGRSGNDEIWICNADASHPVQLTGFRNAWVGSPRWSPDGQKITFDSNAAGNWDIYVIGSEGGRAVRLTTTETQEFRPSWSHDGKWVYFSSTRTGQPQIWKIPAAGGAAVAVTRHGGDVAFESVDGDDLYYTKNQQLWKMPVRGGEETRVLGSVLDNNFALAKHGIYFLRGAASDAKLRVEFLSFATHSIRTVGTVPGPSADEINVSPDERWLLFGTNGGAGSELMLIENFR
jgi:Tol biopolymer transport system component/DNA-binding winged helix-turn-helix (wHTH) protein